MRRSFAIVFLSSMAGAWLNCEILAQGAEGSNPSRPPPTKAEKPSPDWSNVGGVDDFLAEYVVSHPIAKKLIADRYVNYLHDKFGDRLKVLNDRLDPVFSPTDWIQAVDHAANGEFDQLKTFAAEAVGKKLVETLFPVGGTLLTQAYDYAKMVSAEVQAWGNQKDVQAFVKGYMSADRKIDWEKMTSKQMTVAYLNASIQKEWDESREKFGNAQWTQSRDVYLDKQLRVQCWEAVMDMAAKYRKHLSAKEALREEARAEQRRLVEHARQEYLRLTKIAKLLYYAGEVPSPRVDDCAEKIASFLKLDKAGQEAHLEKARRGYAEAMGERDVRRAEDHAKRLGDHYKAYGDDDAVNRLLAFPEPEYKLFYDNLRSATERLLSGRLTYEVYRGFVDRNKRAWEDLTVWVVRAKKEAFALTDRVGVYGEPEKEARAKGNRLENDVAEHGQGIARLIEELENKVAAKVRSKIAEYDAIIKSGGAKERGVARQPAQPSQGERLGSSVAPVANSFSLDYLEEVPTSDVRTTVDTVPQRAGAAAQGDVIQFSYDLEAAVGGVGERLHVKAAQRIDAIREDDDSADSLGGARHAETVERWICENQAWVDCATIRGLRQFEAPEALRERAMAAAIRRRDARVDSIESAEVLVSQEGHVRDVRDYLAFTCEQTRGRVSAAKALSERAAELASMYPLKRFEPSVSVPGGLSGQDARRILDAARDTPDSVTLPFLVDVLDHLDAVTRDLGAGGYQKILEPSYQARNEPQKYFFEKIPHYGTYYCRWDLHGGFAKEKAGFKALQPHLRALTERIGSVPEGDLDDLRELHVRTLELKGCSERAPLHKWESQSIERAVEDASKLKAVADAMDWVRVARERLEKGIAARDRIQEFMKSNEPRHRSLIQSCIDKAIGLRGADRAAALASARKAHDHAQFALIYLPFALTEHNTLLARSEALVSELSSQHAGAGGDPETDVATGTLAVNLQRGRRAESVAVAITITDVKGRKVGEGAGPHHLAPGEYIVNTFARYMERDPASAHVRLSSGKKEVVNVRVWQDEGEDDDEPGSAMPPGPGPAAETFERAVVLPCAPDEDFVRSLYHCITHREPAPEELGAQVGRLRGGITRQLMVTYFFASPGYVNEKHDGARFMTDACQAIYARQPTAAELRAWPRTDRKTIISEMFKNPAHLAATRDCAAKWRKAPADARTDAAHEDTPRQDPTKSPAYEKYMEAFNAMARIMAAGKGGTPEGQEAHKKYMQAKEAYEKSLKGSTPGAKM